MLDLARQISALPVSFLGRLLYKYVPYKRQVVMANIDRVYGEQLTKLQKKYLAISYYSHLLKSFKEALQLRFMSEKILRAQVEVRGYEHMLAVLAQQKGVLVLTGHFGNWEVAPIGGVLNFKEFQGQFHFIRRTLSIKLIERSLLN
ncbi:lysophospholipid acyltransferase family protein, partial [Legionella sp.]|uniref:lysophospholipid acyltransferase family protein n=1 Tax=Legionella sp. TaxID=459 RepID=UPI003CB672F7